MSIYDRAARALLAAEPVILVESDEPAGTFMQHVLRANPKLLCSITGFRTNSANGALAITPVYRNKTSAVADREEIEQLLRHCVSAYYPNVTLVLPTRTNIRWIMKCFMNETAAFYPNLQGYQSVLTQYGNVPFVSCEVQFRYRIGTVMLRQMEETTARRVEELCKLLFPPGLLESAKCLIAHNYLADTITYVDKQAANPLERSCLQSAYGALVKRECVCHGYADAYKRLLNAADIPCDLVIGRILNGSKEMHAWNIVRLRAGMISCHIDVTWDSKRCAVESTHFLKGDAFYIGKREWNRHFHSPCVDGDELAKEAKAYCAAHRRELLASGLDPRWIE